MKKIKLIEITIPVYNEEKVLEKNIRCLDKFLGKNINYKYKIIIANNASTDRTLSIAKNLSKRFKNVRYIHLDKKGRGGALRKSWLSGNADIVSYMDVDLSTELRAFPKLINALEKGYDIATGSRLMKGSKVKRSLKREILSRGYNFLLKLFFITKISDAQCGFKAISKRAAKILIPEIKDNDWFFDTELLLLGEKHGLKIAEISIGWVEDPDTRVKIFKTVYDYLLNIIKTRFSLWFMRVETFK